MKSRSYYSFMDEPRSESFHYLLGDSRTETERLRAQAALWDPVSHALFDRIGVSPGWRVLEVGPGAGSLHAELRRRVSGPVDAVEQSTAFANALIERSRGDGLGDGAIWNMQLIDAPLESESYDLVFARWVFLFLPDPLAHLRKLARAVKPGGLVALQDYFRDSFCLVPEPDDWSALVTADHAFFASQGGDASIGTRLPRFYEHVGLDLIEIVPTVKWGNPGSPVWNWLTTYFLGVLDEYTRFPPLTREAAHRIHDQWHDATRHPASLLIAPTLLDVVGRKRLHG